MSAVPHYFVFENQRPLTSQAHGGLLAVDPFTQEVRHSQAHVLSGWAPDVVNDFLLPFCFGFVCTSDAAAEPAIACD